MNNLTSFLLISAALIITLPACAALAQSPTQTHLPALVKMPNGGQASQESTVVEADRLVGQARAFYEQGKYVEAIPLMERALTIREQRLGVNHATIAVTLNHLGKLYEETGDLARAERVYRRSMEIIEKLLGPNSPEVVVPLSNLALLYRLKGDYMTAERLLKQSIAIFEKARGTDQPDVAELLTFLANVYGDKGDYVQAEDLVRRALAIRVKALGPDDIYVAQSLNNLAVLLQKVKGDYRQAETLFKRALRIVEKALGPDHHYTTMALQSLADLYIEEGNYRDAEPLLIHSLKIREKTYGPNHIEVAKALNALVTLYVGTGDYLTAEEMSKRALAIFKRILGPDHQLVATTLNNLAWIYGARGDLEIAEQLYNRALAINEKALGPNHIAVARSLNNLAGNYLKKDDFAKAEPLLKRALEIRERVLGPEHPETGVSINNLAALYENQGNYVGAEQMYRRALAIYEKAYSPWHPAVALSANNLGGVYQVTRDYARANESYSRALAIREKVLGPEHPDTAVSLANLSILKTAEHKIAEAVALRARANEIFERNLTLMLTAGSEIQKLLYGDTLLGGTSSTVSLHVNVAPDNTEAARLALTTILRRKGRILDAMSDQIGALRRRLSPQDRVLLDELSVANSRLAALTLKGVGQADPVQYRTEVVQLKGKIERLEAEVSRRSAEFRTQVQPVTIERVRNAIPTSAALIEIVSYHPFKPEGWTKEGRWGAEHYAAYLLRHEGEPSFVDLGEAAPIDQAVLRFRAALADPKTTDFKQIARALDELVMRPIRKLLGETRTVLLSPDGQLNLVPFAALVDEGGHYLVENYTFDYLTSGRDLLRLDAQAQSRQPPVVMANPTFDLVATTNNQKVGESVTTSGHRSLDFNTLRINPLPGTAQEAAAIKSIVPSAQLFTERAATESALKGVAGPRFLHIATHGFFLQDQPPQMAGGSRRIKISDQPRAAQGENPLLRSGLLLAGAQKRQGGAGEDGVLTALEAAGLDLWGTKLVVLSACDTGIGQVANGDGVYGLRRALVIAGAESQLMSLWQVSDTATRDLMVNYYRLIEGGEERSAALRAAQLEMLSGNKREGQTVDRRISMGKSAGGANYSHPYYWASFVPIGDWRSINNSKKVSLVEMYQPTVTVTLPPDTALTIQPDTVAKSSDKSRPARAPRASVLQVRVAKSDPAVRNPDSFETHMRAAADFYKSRNLSEAASYLQRALALNPNDVDALTMMGNVKYDTGDFVSAAFFYQRSLTLRPNNAEVRADLGNTYFYQASPDYNAAITEYRKALKISPKDEKVWHNLAAAALRNKSELTPRDAINQLAEINPSNPNLTMLRSALASLLSAGKQVVFDEAIRVVTMHK